MSDYCTVLDRSLRRDNAVAADPLLPTNILLCEKHNRILDIASAAKVPRGENTQPQRAPRAGSTKDRTAQQQQRGTVACSGVARHVRIMFYNFMRNRLGHL
ncbi:unnamed protein product [Sphacelaria rigidula]